MQTLPGQLSYRRRGWVDLLRHSPTSVCVHFGNLLIFGDVNSLQSHWKESQCYWWLWELGKSSVCDGEHWWKLLQEEEAIPPSTCQTIPRFSWLQYREDDQTSGFVSKSLLVEEQQPSIH